MSIVKSRHWLLTVGSILPVFAAVAVADEPAKKDPPKPALGKIEKRTYDFTDAKKEMEYAIYVPSKYDKDKKWPLVVGLHGLGGNPNQFIRTRGMTDLAEKLGFIVVAPMGYSPRGGYGMRFGKPGKDDPQNMSELSEKDVMNVLEIVRKDFNIDSDRIYLMGHSMGGGGTWHLAIKHPDIWAGLGPVAPAIFETADGLNKIKHIPVFLVQGDMDNLVRPAGARRWAAKMKELGMTYEYVEVEGGDHINILAPNVPKMFEYFAKYKKGDVKPKDEKKEEKDKKN
jgi:poly(3-hydroxybutyrate) depolymerase